MSKRFGFDLLSDQAAQHARELVDDLRTADHEFWSRCESEIERLLAAALVARGWMGIDNHTAVLMVENDFGVSGSNSLKTTILYVKQQVNIENIGRVDFLVHAFDHHARILKAPGWRELIVECDGHDFHERTKEQAKRDRSRDRRATLAGRDVMRFTGSELWRDPWGCAGEIMDWASSSFG